MNFVTSETVRVALKSPELSKQIWALNKLPMGQVANFEGNISRCFQYILDTINSHELEFIEFLRFAVLRECEMYVLSSEDRIRIMYPIVIKMVQKVGGAWFEALSKLVESTTKEKLPRPFFEDAAMRFAQCHRANQCDCASVILNNLMKNNHCISKNNIIALTKNKNVLKNVLKNLCVAMEKNNYSQNMLFSVIKVLPATSETIDIILSLNNASEQMIKFIQPLYIGLIKPNTLVSTMKHWKRSIELGFMDLDKIFREIFRIHIFDKASSDILVKFFNEMLEQWNINNKAGTNNISNPNLQKYQMRDQDILLFYQEIYNISIEKAFQIAVQSIRKCPMLENSITDLYCSDRSIGYFNSWCNLYNSLRQVLNDNNKEKQLNFLRKKLTSELLFGHNTNKNGIKTFKTTQSTITVPSNKSFSDDFKNIKELEKIVATVENDTVCRCWREATRMLQLLPVEKEDLRFMTKAIEVHGRPAVSTIVTMLSKLSDEVVVKYIDDLTKSNSNKQITVVNLMYGILKSKVHPSLFSFFMDKMINMIMSKTIKDIVKCCIIRQFYLFKEYAKTEEERNIAIEQFKKFEIFKGSLELEDAIKTADTFFKIFHIKKLNYQILNQPSPLSSSQSPPQPPQNINNKAISNIKSADSVLINDPNNKQLMKSSTHLTTVIPLNNTPGKIILSGKFNIKGDSKQIKYIIPPKKSRGLPILHKTADC